MHQAPRWEWHSPLKPALDSTGTCTRAAPAPEKHWRTTRRTRDNTQATLASRTKKH
jgi:hypothetical protein